MGHWGTCPLSTFICLIFLVHFTEPHKLWHLTISGCIPRKNIQAYNVVTAYCMNFIIVLCVTLKLFSSSLVPPPPRVKSWRVATPPFCRIEWVWSPRTYLRPLQLVLSSSAVCSLPSSSVSHYFCPETHATKCTVCCLEMCGISGKRSRYRTELKTFRVPTLPHVV